MTLTFEDNLPRPAGRPRKWADDAERARAYRARKARQLANPLQLRSQVRELKSALRLVTKDLTRARRKSETLANRLSDLTDRHTKAAARAESTIARLQDQVADLSRRAKAAESRCRLLTDQLEQAHAREVEPRAATPLFTEPRDPDAFRLNRAQRRALTRRR